MKKKLLIVALLSMTLMVGCEEIPTDGTKNDIKEQKNVSSVLSKNQSTPTDIDYSLERYNLIKRAYWVNGQREKANMLQCEIEKPLGYIVLFTESGNAIGEFIVDGKVSSLNSFLTPNYIEEYNGNGVVINTELADVDGSYGENDNGIFFFTPDGRYIEWTGIYLYSDIPFNISNTLLEE